jgi:hypothetical protein
MRFVIRKSSLFDNLFLTASHRWGRLDKAKAFNEKRADQVAGTLPTNNYGIFDLGHAKHMVKNEGHVKAWRTVFRYASRLLESVKPKLRAKLLGPGQTPQGIIHALGPFEVKDASHIDAKGCDVISDRAFLNFRTLREAEAVCTCLDNICKGTFLRNHNKVAGGPEPADRGRKES